MTNTMTETKQQVNGNLPVVASQKVILSAHDVRDQVQLIQQVMVTVMKEGDHYGKIPGCGPKPTLLKAGAEKLVSTFRLAPKYEEIAGSKEEDNFLSYKIRCDLIHIPTGNFVGSGLGTCNSKEKKYIKASPWDIQNTLYKMACKRALVAATLNATAASDIFTQDIEDMDFPRQDIRPATVQAAPNASEMIKRFFDANDELSKQFGPDAYKQYLRNSKGDSPTVDQIRTWKTPKQIAWLRTATEAIEEKLSVVEEYSEEVIEGEVSHG